MHPPEDMTTIVNRKRYSVATATLLAGDDYWDGNNWERSGRNEFLYRTPNGNYFAVYLTRWQGERDNIQPLSQEEAIDLYEQLTEHRVDFPEAFPGVELKDA